MIKIDMYEDYCWIWVDKLSAHTIGEIMKIIEKYKVDYEVHNKSVTILNPTYEFLYDISCIDYVILL